MRNRFGVEIKKGYYVFAHHPRGGMIEGRARIIDREPGRGYVVTLDSGYTVAADDVTQVLPPMKITRGGVVKANPDIHIDIQSHNTKGRNVRAKNPVLKQAAGEFKAYGKHRWFGESTNQWAIEQGFPYELESVSIHGNAPLALSKTRAYVMIDEDENGPVVEVWPIRNLRFFSGTPQIGGWTRKANPLSRVKVNSRSMATGKPPSAKLKRRREATEAMPIPGIYANPLTRVRIASDSQRSRTNAAGKRTKSPSRRLMKRRAYTDMMPPGFYANPVGYVDHAQFRVQVKTESGWRTIGASSRVSDAKSIARAYAKAHPSATVRVIE